MPRNDVADDAKYGDGDGDGDDDDDDDDILDDMAMDFEVQMVMTKGAPAGQDDMVVGDDIVTKTENNHAPASASANVQGQRKPKRMSGLSAAKFDRPVSQITINVSDMDEDERVMGSEDEETNQHTGGGKNGGGGGGGNDNDDNGLKPPLVAMPSVESDATSVNVLSEGVRRVKSAEEYANEGDDNYEEDLDEEIGKLAIAGMNTIQ